MSGLFKLQPTNTCTVICYKNYEIQTNVQTHYRVIKLCSTVTQEVPAQHTTWYHNSAGSNLTPHKNELTESKISNSGKLPVE